MKTKTMSKRKNTGFTLIEVMTGMAIISIVSSIVLPGINNFYSGTRVQAEAEMFVQNLRLGKFKAMQEQAVHRLIFSPEGDAYKVQIHIGYNEGSVAPDLTTGITDVSYYDNNWESILDTEEISIDPGVKIVIDPYVTTPNPDRIIYFWPDGYLVTHNSIGINEVNKLSFPECYVSFTYGSSLMRVYINALGVLSSESYAVDADGDSDADVIW